MDPRTVYAFKGPFWLDPGFLDRFWAQVDVRGPDQCWPWLGYLNPKMPYGQIRVRSVLKRAHQISWCIANARDWPAGKHGCHSCDNPPCVNPAHIWPGTDKQNFDDSVAKGRWRGPAAANRRKSHCVHGHPLAGENLRIRKDGSRSCRSCCLRRTREWLRKKRTEGNRGKRDAI